MKKTQFLVLLILIGLIGYTFWNTEEVQSPTTEKIQISTTEEPQNSATKETKIEGPVAARIDLSTALTDGQKPQFEIYVDGSETPERPISWMTNNRAHGYATQREGNGMSILIKVTDDAKINMALRGPDTRDKNGKRYESWVKYTSVTVNDEEILPEPVSVWHDKPFRYTLDAKADNAYIIQAKWMGNE